FARAAVNRGLEPIQTERIAVLADVGLSGSKQAEARLVAAGVVGEHGRQGAAAASAVGHEIFEDQLVRAEIVDPKSSGGGRPREVDNGQGRRTRDVAARDSRGGGVQ